jgi:hypothetical protein
MTTDLEAALALACAALLLVFAVTDLARKWRKWK